MNTPDALRPFRVLSLDGGGMRGLYTANLLHQLATRFSGTKPEDELDLGSGFDLIVGTSTGGILGTALAYGLSIRDVINLYRTVGPRIFTNPQPQSQILFAKWAALAFGSPANSPAALKAELERLFGTTTVKELFDRRKIGLCLTAVKMIDEKFRVFKTPHLPGKDYDNPYTLVDICLATSAAPIFLPLAGITSPRNPDVLESYADGGLAANNPVLIGLVEALHMAEHNRPIHILSVGTCSAPEGTILNAAALQRGLFQWKAGAKALTLAMNAQASSADFTAGFLAKWLSKKGQEVRVVRFPEERRSEAHMKFLQMDLASDDALHAFSSFGSDDAIAAYRLCQDEACVEGKIITETFRSMKRLNQQEKGNRP